MERRLAAIFAADVVGYSRLMGEDEEGTLARLKAYRETIDGLISSKQFCVFGNYLGTSSAGMLLDRCGLRFAKGAS